MRRERLINTTGTIANTSTVPNDKPPTITQPIWWRVSAPAPVADKGAREERVRMSKLRQVVAKRLKSAQETAAILTTFNEVNMQPAMDIRKQYKDQFEKAHGVRLGFMSFFTLAAIEALKRFPAVNASIDDNDIVYHGYYDIGIAVSSPRGLVVPRIKHAASRLTCWPQKLYSAMTITKIGVNSRL